MLMTHMLILKRRRWSLAVLDDGTRLQIKDLFGFAEKVENKW